MRYPLSALTVALFIVSGCVTGPVTEGPATTRGLSELSGSEGAKLVAIATRGTMGWYSGKMARVWRIWERGEARVKGKLPSGDLTPAQAQTWANTQADALLKAASDKLATLDRKRAVVLENIRKLHANQIAAVDGIIAGWRAQGKVTREQYRTWLDVGRYGAGLYIEQQHIKRVREEAKKAAAEEAEAENGE